MSADLTSLLRDALYPRHKAAECKRAACHPCATYDGQARRLAVVIESSDWLAEHDREVAAGAWDEGYAKGNLDGYFGTSDEREKNPHGTEHRAQAIREGRA